MTGAGSSAGLRRRPALEAEDDDPGEMVSAAHFMTMKLLPR
jgi:hypothetical protein